MNDEKCFDNFFNAILQIGLQSRNVCRNDSIGWWWAEIGGNSKTKVRQ